MARGTALLAVVGLVASTLGGLLQAVAGMSGVSRVLALVAVATLMVLQTVAAVAAVGAAWSGRLPVCGYVGIAVLPACLAVLVAVNSAQWWRVAVLCALVTVFVAALRRLVCVRGDAA